MTITPTELAEWRAVVEKATPGPWRHRCRGTDINPQHVIDYDFLALSRTVVPQLIDEVEAGRREIERLKSLCGDMTTIEMAVRKDLASATAELTALRDENEWRDMESTPAPKDSTWILAVVRTGRQAVIRWDGGAWKDDNRLCRDPVRWRPLPLTATETAETKS